MCTAFRVSPYSSAEGYYLFRAENAGSRAQPRHYQTPAPRILFGGNRCMKTGLHLFKIFFLSVFSFRQSTTVSPIRQTDQYNIFADRGESWNFTRSKHKVSEYFLSRAHGEHSLAMILHSCTTLIAFGSLKRNTTFCMSKTFLCHSYHLLQMVRKTIFSPSSSLLIAAGLSS